MSDVSIWTLPATGLGGVLLIKTWDWWTQRRSLRAAEGGASTLIEGLSRRILELETKQTELGKRLDAETKARLTAQETAAMLRVHVRQLEAALRAAGIDVPILPELEAAA